MRIQRRTAPRHASFNGIIFEKEIFLSGKSRLALLDLGGEAEHVSIQFLITRSIHRKPALKACRTTEIFLKSDTSEF